MYDVTYLKKYESVSRMKTSFFFFKQTDQSEAGCETGLQLMIVSVIDSSFVSLMKFLVYQMQMVVSRAQRGIFTFSLFG